MRWPTTSVLVALVVVATAPTANAQSVGWAGQPFTAVNSAAKSGDKAAQLELGKRYESGSGGASCNWRLAERWYSRASRTSGTGERLVYSAPVGRERFGRMMDAGSGRKVPGLPEATRRLDLLRRAKLAGSNNYQAVAICGRQGMSRK